MNFKENLDRKVIGAGTIGSLTGYGLGSYMGIAALGGGMAGAIPVAVVVGSLCAMGVLAARGWKKKQ